MDAFVRWRAPAAVIALAAATLALLVRLVAFASAWRDAGDGPRSEAFSALPIPAGSVVLTLAAGLLVVSCFAAPAVPGRRALAGWGALVAGASLLAGLLALAVAVRPLSPAGMLAAGITPLSTLTVPLLVGWALVVAAARREPVPSVPAVPAVPARAPEPEPDPDPEAQPTWSPDAAAGAVWRTAGEAARGGPASGWGASGGSGWARPAEPGDDPDPDTRS